MNCIFYNDVENVLKNGNAINVISRFKKCLEKIKPASNVLIVGSGGSYVAGLYAKYIIEKNKTNLCEVLKPMEVSQTNMQLYSYAIIYSYKMNNYDIKMAIKCILEASNIKKVFIVTARKINKVYDDRVEYIYYDEDSE